MPCFPSRPVALLNHLPLSWPSSCPPSLQKSSPWKRRKQRQNLNSNTHFANSPCFSCTYQTTFVPSDSLPVLMFCLSYCYHFADQVSSWTRHWWVLGATLLSSRLSSSVTKLEQTYVGWLTVSCSDQVSQHWEKANPLCLAMGNTEVPTALVCQDLL